MTSSLPTRTSSDGRGFAIGGIVCAAVGVLLFGVLLGPIGAALGFVGVRKGERTLGWVAVALGVVVFVLSLVGVAVLTNRM